MHEKIGPVSKNLDYPNPPIVEREGKRLAIIALTDLDGTAFDETIPERDRLFTIKPAQEAIAQLQQANIPVGIITSRSYGEALQSSEALGCKGIIICEDGAAIVLPSASIDGQARQMLEKKFKLVEHQGATVLLLSELTPDKIDQFLLHVDKEVRKVDPTDSIISTRFSSAEQLQQAAQHATVEAARLSADRVASAYVAKPSNVQREIIAEKAPKWGIRAFGEHINLIGTDANKGKAIKVIDEHIELILKGIDCQGIIPIVFGNNRNDLALFAEAHRMGGLGVIVGHPNGSYFVPEADIPPFVIKAASPYGHGMLDSIPQILNSLRENYNVDLR